jgi:hypothetical protein
MFLLPVIAPRGVIRRRDEMRNVVWAALVLLALWEAIAGTTPTPPPHTATLDSDCGAGIDPTGGCRH